LPLLDLIITKKSKNQNEKEIKNPKAKTSLIQAHFGLFDCAFERKNIKNIIAF
jgi:hypothetical protein